MAPARRDYDDDDYDSPRRREDDRPSRSDRNDDYDDDPPPRRRSRYDFADRSFRRDDYEEDDDDYDDRSSGRRGVGCRHCGSTRRPYVTTQISPAGWVIFAVMLAFCAPLFFIGLLMTEEVRTCPDCGSRVS